MRLYFRRWVSNGSGGRLNNISLMISLQHFDKNDFKQLLAWETDEEALMQFAGPSFNFPLTADQLELSLQDNKRLIYKVVFTPGNIDIGHAEIYFPDDTTALLCRILIGD